MKANTNFLENLGWRKREIPVIKTKKKNYGEEAPKKNAVKNGLPVTPLGRKKP